MRRVEADKERVLKLRLFYGEVGAGMLQFIREGNGVLACDRGKVLAQIGGEVQRDLLCLLRVLIAKVIDSHHRVVDEVRPHLQYQDFGALMSDLMLLTYMLFHIIREDQTE